MSLLVMIKPQATFSKILSKLFRTLEAVLSKAKSVESSNENESDFVAKNTTILEGTS